jgi:DNA invertase Pin-like site-specific DNA recombinase
VSTAPALIRAYIYGRQSQASDRSINEQLVIGRERAEAEGWHVAAEFSDGVSASRRTTRKRDDWPELVTGVEAGQADAIWLWESSRGDRKAWQWLWFLETCRDQGVLIYIETDRRLYDMTRRRDWQTLAEDGVDNQAESDKIADRVIRAMADNAVNGKVHGRVPYGYQRQYETTPSGRRIVAGQEPHAAEAAVVRRIFASLAAGGSLRATTAALNADQVPTRSGRPWVPSTVRGIALSYTYAGKRVHDPGHHGGHGHRMSPDAKIYDATWPPLVDDERFYAVRRILLDPRRKTTRPGKVKHLLSMIATCGACGGPLTVTYRKLDGKRPAYACRDRSCFAIDQADLDEHVTDEVLTRLARPDELERIKAAQATGDRELVEARATLAEIKDHHARMVAELRDRRMSPEAFSAAEPGVLAERDAAEARVRTLETPPKLRFLLDGTGALDKQWDRAPVTARREVIRDVCEIAVDRSPVRGHRVPAGQRTKITWR